VFVLVFLGQVIECTCAKGKTMKTTKHIILGLLAALPVLPANALEIDGVNGTLLLDGRVRFEAANTTGLKDSDALTYRLRLGYQAELNDFVTLLAEGEFTVDTTLGDYDAYPNAEGDNGYTLIADPQNVELNRFQLDFDFEPVKAVVGRQRIIRNNARFVGNVGWRQNEQTFDAVSLSASPVEGLELYYAYLDTAHRIFGQRASASALKKWEMDNHVIEASYAAPADVKVGAYAYLFEIKTDASASSDTYGIWASGKLGLDAEDQTLSWRVEWARQSDNGMSTGDFENDYYHFTLAAEAADLGTVTVGYEILEGNGERGFSTPLATLHAHNGFADAFLSTPANGLVDLYIKAATKFGDNLSAALIYHDFEAETGSVDFGEEIDLVVGYKISESLSTTAKVAVFDGKAYANITKLWVQVDMKF
jgi:hypothetical protein